MAETWAWISGWAIDPQRFQTAAARARPDVHHVVFAPTSDAVEQVLTTPADRILGYSLGSLLLLHAAASIPPETEMHCLAPILAFCRESGRGGTTPEASLSAIQQRLSLNPAQALKLFYRLAGLTETAPQELPYGEAELAWGLEMLRTLQVPQSATARAAAALGRGDRLLDHHSLRQRWPGVRLMDGTHCYLQLLSYVKEIH